MQQLDTRFFTKEETEKYNNTLELWEQTQKAFADQHKGTRGDNEKELLDTLHQLDTIDAELFCYRKLYFKRLAEDYEKKANEQQRPFEDVVLDDVNKIIRDITKEQYEQHIEKDAGRIRFMLYRGYPNATADEQKKIVKYADEQIELMKQGGAEGFIAYINVVGRWEEQATVLLLKHSLNEHTKAKVNNLIITWAKENYLSDGEQLTIHLEETQAPPIQREVLPALAVAPTKWIRPTSKLVNNLWLNNEDNVVYDVAPLTDKTVRTAYSLNYSHLKENGITGLEKLTEDDEAVLNGVITLIAQNPGRAFTPATVFKTMVGSLGTRPTPEQLKDVEHSLDKMRFTELTIDGTAEAKARGFEDIKQLSLSGNFLEARKIESVYERGGKLVKTKLYIPTAQPLIMQYSDAINEVSRVPLKTLNTPVDNTKKNIRLRLYLMKQIDAMHKGSHRSNSIKFETLYEKLEATTNKQKDSIRRDALKMLEYWKEEKYIKEYSLTKKGKAYYSIVIK